MASDSRISTGAAQGKSRLPFLPLAKRVRARSRGSFRIQESDESAFVLVVVLVLGFEWPFAEVRVRPSLHAEYDDEDEP